LKWLGEEGRGAASVVERAVAVSVPMDLAAAAGELDVGLKKMVYTRHFMRSLRPKVLAKISTHGLAIDTQAVHVCSTFREIDNLYTAPFHGFENADDYWRRASSKPWLRKIQVPTRLINAKNDPFLPAAALPTKAEVSDSVILEYPETGGHVGFVSGKWPGRLEWLPKRILGFFAE
jgi:predicted alpha/beta-fold hydrolase